MADKVKRIAVVAGKGGTGKTTTAVMLARAAHLASRPAMVVDADPQMSAFLWSAATDHQLGFPVQAVSSPELIVHADPGTWVFIDTPPGVGDRPFAKGALVGADLAIMPLGTSPLEIAQFPATTKLIDAEGCPLIVLVVRAGLRTVNLRRTIEALDDAGVLRFRTVVPYSAAKDGLSQVGGTVPRGVGAYATVFTELHEGFS